jgi:hypothetical protein
LVDPIDEVAITNLKSYKEKNFIDISKEDLDLGLFIGVYLSELSVPQRVDTIYSCFFHYASLLRA